MSRWNESRAGGDTLLMSGGVQADNATIRLIAPVFGSANLIHDILAGYRRPA